jgi:signal transduction histidine kinase
MLTRIETRLNTPAREPRKKLAVLLGVLLICSAVYAVGLFFQIGGKAFEPWRSLILNIPPSFLSALIIFMVSREHTGHLRRLWFWLALGLVSFGIGDCVWAYIQLVLKVDPFPSLADAFYLFQPTFFLLAFWFVPRDRAPSRLADAKLGLDIAITLSAILVVAWRAYLANTILEYDKQYLALGLSLIYPIMDLLELTILFLLVFSKRSFLPRTQVIFLACGLILLATFDFFFNIQEAAKLYTPGNPIDLFGMLSSVFFSFAAITSLNETKPASSATSPFQQRLSWINLSPIQIITRVAIITVYIVFAAFHSSNGFNQTGTLLLTGIVIVLALWRQTLELNDNAELNRNLLLLSSNLEQRVQERTAELSAKTFQLEQSRAQLVANEKLANLGRFTASVAHEVNTPLAASMYDLSHAQELVLEYQKSILSPEVTKDDHLEIAREIQETHARIHNSLERLGRFIRRVREQSRISTGDAHDFDARHTLRDAFVHLEYQAFEHNVKLEIHLPEEAVMIHGDPQRLIQALNELVINSLQTCPKHDQAGQYWVRIVLDPDLNHALLSIETNGDGMTGNSLEQTFEPTFNGKLLESQGLGLSVAHDIIKGHFAGDIQVRSELGRGTRFMITLPKAAKETP